MTAELTLAAEPQRHPVGLRSLQRSEQDLLRKKWRKHLIALGIAWAIVLTLFHRDAAHLISVWWWDSTFNHCFLILPIIAWLVAQRRPQLARVTPAAWTAGLLPVALGAMAWLLGAAGEVALARHAGVVLMLQGGAVACLGKAAARALAFPIFYGLFLIPVGKELIPALQTVTAELAMFLLGQSGVPAHLEGVFITTPSGYFEVAEACSGVKFLIAMVALGALVANLCFRSWRRRFAFLAFAIAVPILANGVRAWGTIYIAHRTSLQFAAGFDHVLYGGIFFALVVALVLGLAWRFFDRPVDDPWFDPAALPANAPARLSPVAGAAVALAALPLLWLSAIAAGAARPLPSGLAFPEVEGWQRLPPGGDWRPRFAGADRFGMARYRDGGGRQVDVAVAVYAQQGEGRELVGQGNGAAAPGGRWAWTADAPAPPGGRAERIASHGLARDVVTFYRIGELLTGSGARVKLETMRTRLLGGPQRAVALLVSARAPAHGLSGRPAIDDFLRALGPIEPLADEISGTSGATPASGMN